MKPKKKCPRPRVIDLMAYVRRAPFRVQVKWKPQPDDSDQQILRAARARPAFSIRKLVLFNCKTRDEAEKIKIRVEAALPHAHVRVVDRVRAIEKHRTWAKKRRVARRVKKIKLLVA